METAIEAIGKVAREVGTIATSAAAAHGDADLAASEYLAAVLAVVGPAALRAIGSTRELSYRSHNCGVDCSHSDEVESTVERWIRLTADTAPAKRRTSGTGGEYEGRALCLCVDTGQLAEFAYSGSWTQWLNGWDEWTAAIQHYTTIADAVVDGWDDVEAYAAVIADQLAGYAAGGATDAAKRATSRAAKLRACTALLK